MSVTMLPIKEEQRLLNRLRGIMRQTVGKLMGVSPPKTPQEASTYHATVGDIWAAGILECLKIHDEEKELYRRRSAKGGLCANEEEKQAHLSKVPEETPSEKEPA